MADIQHTPKPGEPNTEPETKQPPASWVYDLDDFQIGAEFNRLLNMIYGDDDHESRMASYSLAEAVQDAVMTSWGEGNYAINNIVYESVRINRSYESPGEER